MLECHTSGLTLMKVTKSCTGKSIKGVLVVLREFIKKPRLTETDTIVDVESC